MGSYLGAALAVYYVSRRTYNLYQSTWVSCLKGLRHLVGGNIGPGCSQFHFNLDWFFDPNHSFYWESCCHLTACFSICWGLIVIHSTVEWCLETCKLRLNNSGFFQFVLEKNWNMWLPGFGFSDIRQRKRPGVTEAHKARLALIRKSLRKYWCISSPQTFVSRA